MAPRRFSDALREGIAEEMRDDPRVIIFGEDVAVGGAFGVTESLLDEFGDRRVINTPISEDTIMGLAVGAAVPAALTFVVSGADVFLTSIPGVLAASATWAAFGGLLAPISVAAARRAERIELEGGGRTPGLASGDQ